MDDLSRQSLLDGRPGVFINADKDKLLGPNGEVLGELGTCPLCQQMAERIDDLLPPDLRTSAKAYSCFTCGNFAIMKHALAIPSDQRRHLNDLDTLPAISAETRRITELRKKQFRQTLPRHVDPMPVFTDYTRGITVPKNFVGIAEILEKGVPTAEQSLSQLLQNIQAMTDATGQWLTLNHGDYPLAMARNDETFAFLVATLSDQRYISCDPEPKKLIRTGFDPRLQREFLCAVQLTMEGLRAAKMQETDEEGDKTTQTSSHTVKKMKVFISHWSVEKPLALGLKSWLKTEGIDAFCSSDYDDMMSNNWLERVQEDLKLCDLGVFLMSPYSKDNKWIAYELGFMKSFSKPTWPMTFAGLSHTHLAEMYTRDTVIALDAQSSSAQFNSFCRNVLQLPGLPNHDSYYARLIEHLTCFGESHRVLQFGKPAAFTIKAVTKTEAEALQMAISSDVENTVHKPLYLPRYDANGQEVAAVRVKFTPLSADTRRHFKFGISLTRADNSADAKFPGKNHNEVFMFHASVENTISSWSLYKDEVRERPYNPAGSLAYDEDARISLWLRAHGNEVLPDAIDSDQKVIELLGPRSDGFWGVIDQNWKFVKIDLWRDERVNLNFKVEYEVDRYPKI